jgi:uncharacterized membrane protein
MRPQSSRLAVQLHNRKHPIPVGVYVVLAGIVLVVLAFALLANDENSEAGQVREDTRRDRERAKDFLDRSNRKESLMKRLDEEKIPYYQCDACAGTGVAGKGMKTREIVECSPCNGSGIRSGYKK